MHADSTVMHVANEWCCPWNIFDLVAMTVPFTHTTCFQAIPSIQCESEGEDDSTEDFPAPIHSAQPPDAAPAPAPTAQKISPDNSARVASTAGDAAAQIAEYLALAEEVRPS